MDGNALASQPIAHAGLRVLATEQDGPRPAGTPGEATGTATSEPPTMRATRP